MANKREILEALKEIIDDQPTGGTERERQAFRNGACELAEFLVGDSPEYWQTVAPLRFQDVSK